VFNEGLGRLFQRCVPTFATGGEFLFRLAADQFQGADALRKTCESVEKTW